MQSAINRKNYIIYSKLYFFFQFFYMYNNQLKNLLKMSFKDLKYKKKKRENSIQKINDFICNTFATHYISYIVSIASFILRPIKLALSVGYAL